MAIDLSQIKRSRDPLVSLAGILAALLLLVAGMDLLFRDVASSESEVWFTLKRVVAIFGALGLIFSTKLCRLFRSRLLLYASLWAAVVSSFISFYFVAGPGVSQFLEAIDFGIICLLSLVAILVMALDQIFGDSSRMD